ncbi:MAG: hypothetical protein WCA85_11795 [Paraburkholderia sp.]
MSPLFLIKLMELECRADVDRHSHVRPLPNRLITVLRSLFAARRATCNCR